MAIERGHLSVFTKWMLWSDTPVRGRTSILPNPYFYFVFVSSFSPPNTHVHRTWAGWSGWWSLVSTQRQKATGWAAWSREGRSPAVDPVAAAPHTVNPVAASRGGVILLHKKVFGP